MLSGRMPFGEGEDIIDLNRRGKIFFPFKYWKNVSPKAIELVRMMMRIDPTNRPSATKAL
jgi:hypothetical protein